MASLTENPWLQYRRSNYTFKCHRQDPPPGSNEVRVGPKLASAYSVHDLAMNPVYGTFASSGKSDDLVRLCKLPPMMMGPILMDILALFGGVGADGRIMIWDKDSKQRCLSTPRALRLLLRKLDLYLTIPSRPSLGDCLEFSYRRSRRPGSVFDVQQDRKVCCLGEIVVVPAN